MSYSNEELQEKLIDMYPEILSYGLKVGLQFDEAKSAWVVSFTKGTSSR